MTSSAIELSHAETAALLGRLANAISGVTVEDVISRLEALGVPLALLANTKRLDAAWQKLQERGILRDTGETLRIREANALLIVHALLLGEEVSSNVFRYESLAVTHTRSREGYTFTVRGVREQSDHHTRRVS